VGAPVSTSKITLEMSQTLFRRAKAAAATRGQSLKDLVTAALKRELRLSAPSDSDKPASRARAA
jgi:predicted HicB family RNase H-like nuclease